ncbi:hypothetical protein KC367_g8976 [Hortaea werneckii]|nr:hypothetical protein KC367_g8976 [Hortaea werneckii]
MQNPLRVIEPTPSPDLLLQNLHPIALDFIPVMAIGTAADVLTGWIRDVRYVANIEKIPYQVDRKMRACAILNITTTAMMNVHVDQHLRRDEADPVFALFDSYNKRCDLTFDAAHK